MTEGFEVVPRKPCTILLVDDVNDTREMYAFFLRASGFAVHEAADGVDVLALAVEFRPDVVVLDLSLPSMDGWSAMEGLSAHPETAGIPVVILSAHTFPADEERAKQTGAAAFLAKPCPPDQLALRLREVSETCAQAFDSALAGVVSTAPRTGPIPAP
jgi:CheY-like chemotaxis protein